MIVQKSPVPVRPKIPFSGHNNELRTATSQPRRRRACDGTGPLPRTVVDCAHQFVHHTYIRIRVSLISLIINPVVPSKFETLRLGTPYCAGFQKRMKMCISDPTEISYVCK
ncbi:predicted protein [Sclerotinia sclerotiorum 1980 UF-70]|uniref:Uncharacterized protein n=1 Tax=Sclerotinia sclerotiorum (strain ATCC 18683 / 1980 / Ss-1) TaxID=665079 RepID=A7EE34_SCLS1|nr:predicted protein [Sclerotinia sclerotiorum 1980 UF-70]EDO01100.1 predicted protein [Sclerotinia sclerotiorum 1980 UF-70]